MSQTRQFNPAATIVKFCRFAGEHGLPAGIKETLNCLSAVQAVGVGDRISVKMAIRAVLCSSKDDWDAFDYLFETFWSRRTASKSNEAKETKPSLPPGDYP